jgi:hypothetical protein
VKLGGSNEMAKRKKRVAIKNRKLGISISCRVQKPVLKDLDAYRKLLKLSRPDALVKLATDHGRPMRTACAPTARALTTSVPRRNPESTITVMRPFTAAMISGDIAGICGGWNERSMTSSETPQQVVWLSKHSILAHQKCFSCKAERISA